MGEVVSVPPMATNTLSHNMNGPPVGNRFMEWNNSLHNHASPQLDQSFHFQLNSMKHQQQRQQQQQQFQGTVASAQQQQTTQPPEPSQTETSQMCKLAALQEILQSQNCHQLHNFMEFS